MEDTKFLLIIVVVLAAIFIIGGSITGGAISIFRAKPIATTPTTTLQAVPTTGQGCISLTTGQCSTLCDTQQVPTVVIKEGAALCNCGDFILSGCTPPCFGPDGCCARHK